MNEERQTEEEENCMMAWHGILYVGLVVQRIKREKGSESDEIAPLVHTTFLLAKKDRINQVAAAFTQEKAAMNAFFFLQKKGMKVAEHFFV